jgi:ATP-dependent Clp protease ATP-binding subunit ClpC
VVRIVPAGAEETAAQIPFTPRAKKVLELSLREALSLGHNHIGTEHILLGLVRERDGVGARILGEAGADPKKIRQELIGRVPGPSPLPVARMQGPEFGCDPCVRVGPTAALQRLLMVAAARALDDGRLEIDAQDLLLALTRDARTGPLLGGLGVDEATVREAIARRRGRRDPPEASATG